MLIIEDGTGTPDANSYISVDFALNYLLGDRKIKFNSLTDEKKEEALIQGTQLIDILFDYKGSRLTSDQALSFPRVGIELDGFPVEGIPTVVKKAAVEGAWLAITERRLFNNKSDRVIASERIDVISTSYFNPKDAGVNENKSRFEILNKLLKNLIREEEKKGGSSIGSASVIRA